MSVIVCPGVAGVASSRTRWPADVIQCGLHPEPFYDQEAAYRIHARPDVGDGRPLHELAYVNVDLRDLSAGLLAELGALLHEPLPLRERDRKCSVKATSM